MGGIPKMIQVTSREHEIAEQIVKPLDRDNAIDFTSDDERMIYYRLRKRFGWRMTSIVLSKDALRNLEDDPQREVKIEYLQRDLERSVGERKEFRYPRLQAKSRPLLRFSLSMLP